ncbi:hypothetical protein A3D14_02940 [Candidatus Saccharibacteria bacterium RIFCSPHIGHO2_02_FULL_47_12]|nr:MAG: hypothetical protein A3D14_02940 [Candidatus Saccharibacteria bacterium RIFCSPHIGHO2_02_FULL_47_12]
MKQKDIVLIILVVFISTVVAFVFSSFVLSPSKNRSTKVEVVQPITDEFKTPDKKYFNSNSIDPTQLIQIGNSQNPDPFR